MYEKGGGGVSRCNRAVVVLDGKVTATNVLKLRGVEELKEYGGPIGMQMGGDPMMAAVCQCHLNLHQNSPDAYGGPKSTRSKRCAERFSTGCRCMGDLDQAQNFEQVMNTMRGDQANVRKTRI